MGRYTKPTFIAGVILILAMAAFFAQKENNSLVVEDLIQSKSKYQHQVKKEGRLLNKFRKPSSFKVERSSEGKTSSTSNSSSYREAAYDEEQSTTKLLSIPNDEHNLELVSHPQSLWDDWNPLSSNSSHTQPTSQDNNSFTTFGNTSWYGGSQFSNTTLSNNKPPHKKEEPKAVPRIFGQVIPLEGHISHYHHLEIINKAYAGINCVTPRIQLFDLSEMVVLMDNPIKEEELKGKAKFEIENLAELKIDTNNPARYMLQTTGCDKYFQRIITSFFESQDLTIATSLISNLIYTEFDGIIKNPIKLSDLYKKVQDTAPSYQHLDQVYEAVIKNPATSDLFKEVTSGLPIIELEDALPRVHSIKYETKLKEQSTYQYRIEASHWSEKYSLFYEWQIDGQTVSHSPVWEYTPTSNSPAAQEITLYVGKKHEANDEVDLTELHHEFKWNISIENSFPALAPSLKLADTSINPTNDSNINLELISSNLCETFSYFAISEGVINPAILDFNLNCSDPLYPISIEQTTDGEVTFYIWSKDIENRISDSPTALTVILDKTNPEIEFLGLRSFYDADTSFNISWSLTESNSDPAQNFTLEFFNGSNWSEISTPSLTQGPHLNSLFNTNITFSNLNITDAKFRLTYEDLATNITVIESDPFNVIRPSLGSNPSSINFPDTYNLSTSSKVTFDFTNTSLVDSKLCQTVSITGPHAADFTITDNGCSFQAIEANSSCSMGMTATPSEKGIRTANINLVCGNESYSTVLSVNSLNNPPKVASDLTHTMRDNTSWTFSIPSGSDLDNSLDELVYKIIAGPSAGSLISCSSLTDFNSNRTCTYSSPVNFEGVVNIKYIISDGSDQSPSEGLITITVNDLTATDPDLDPFNFTNGSYFTGSLLTLTSNGCDDISAIIIQETSVPPSPSDSSWQSCVTTNGGISFNPQLDSPPKQGNRTIYAFAKDAQNNISSSRSFSFIYDNKPPAIQIAAIPTLPSAENFILSWKLTEEHADDSQSFIIDFYDGSTWSNLTNVALTDGPHDETEFTYLHMIPDSNITGAKYRITYTDLAGQETIEESNSFNIVKPVLGSNPSTLDFEDTLNLATTTLDFSFTNSSEVASKICSAPVISGPHASDFSITLDTCSNERISANGSCSMQASVTPSARGMRTATILLECGVDSYSTTLEVNSFNNPPVATDLALYVRDHSVINFNFPAGIDPDHDNTGLTYIVTQGPSQGALINCEASSAPSTDRSCTYTSPLNLHGQVVIKYKLNDGINDSNEATITITVEDLTPTQPSLTPVNFVAGNSTNAPNLTLTPTTCNDILKVFIQEESTAPTESSSGWQDCNVGQNATYDPSLSNVQGYRTLRVYGIDQNNNISSPQLISFIYDTLPPQINILSIPTLPNGISYPIKWTLTEATVSAVSKFLIEYSLDNGATWNSQEMSVGRDGPHDSTLFTYNWNVPNGVYTNSFFRVSLTDDNGMKGSHTSNQFRILLDLEAPNFSGMRINGSSTPPPTPQKYVYISLEAIDNDTNITHFCFKNDSNPPDINHECWKAVDAPQPGLTPSPTLNLNNFPYLLSFVPGTYKVYAWTKDLSGNISNNNNEPGKDVVTIQYFGDESPVVSSLIVSNTSTPSTPVADNEMIFNAADPIYIKWHAVDDKNILNTIKLYYTTDDLTYKAFANNLSNNINNCSTLDVQSTGCYIWTVPEEIDNEYFRIQLVVEDDALQATSILSLPLNSNRFKVLAGNMDPGIDSHAKSAVFNTPSTDMQLYSLAVTTDGKVFIRDSLNGLLYINPQTGILEQLLPETGESTGDLGPVRSATAKLLHKITLDYQDRLVIWDYDRIRRIDTRQEPMKIETIIGGYNNGSSGTQIDDIIINPADLKINPKPINAALLHALPNGDIYFQAYAEGEVKANLNTLRVYRGSLPNPTINTIRISGAGAYVDHWQGRQMNTTDDGVITYMLNYNTTTSELNKLVVQLFSTTSGCSYITSANVNLGTYQLGGVHPPIHLQLCADRYIKTGMDGTFYQAYNNSPYALRALSRYNVTTNSYERILGNDLINGQGFCPDGSTANTCRSFLTDFFITQDGKTFLLDNGLVRVIDGNGKIQTLYGQRKNYGNNGLAQDARFNNIVFIDHGVGDNVIVYDQTEAILREVKPNESFSQVTHLAGNGQTGGFDFAVPAANQTINGAGWHQTGSFVSNPATGDVYFACLTQHICKLNRISGMWEAYAGTTSPLSDWTYHGSYDSKTMNLGNSYTTSILAYAQGKFVTGHYNYNSDARKGQNSILRETNENNAVSTFIAGKAEVDGVSGCPDGLGSGCNLATTRSSGQAITYYSPNDAWLFEHHDNEIKIIKSGGQGSIYYFDTLEDGVQSMLWRDNILYYCNDFGEVKKIDYINNTEVTLQFPGNGIHCTGKRILWKNASGNRPNRLVFPFIQNGLMGIGEYWNP